MTSGANSLAARDIAGVLHPYTDLLAHAQNGPLVIARGEGVRVWDDTGREYIEVVAGLWCAALGFSNDRLAQAAARQFATLPFHHAFSGKSNEPMVELAEMLLARAPVPMARAFFASSGSEANDTAIKMIWYWNNARGRPRKKKIIGRLKGYHGTTVASASVTGLPNNHRAFDLPLPGFLHTMTPHHYHGAEPGEDAEAFATRCADALDALIVAEGPDTVAAMFAEPIMGAGGVLVPPPTYFEKVQAVLRRHDVLLVADEVICGFGRTGHYWGSQTYGIQPDIITCAKALSAAYLPLAAVLVSQGIFDGLAAQSHEVGTWGHGTTYSGHPVAAAVAVEALRIYDELPVTERASTVGAHLQRSLRRAFGDRPLVGEVRGVGLIGAVELVEDREGHRNFDPARKLGARLMRLCEEEGVITRALPNDTIAFSPPLIIAEDELDEAVARVGRAMDRLERELQHG